MNEAQEKEYRELKKQKMEETRKKLSNLKMLESILNNEVLKYFFTGGALLGMSYMMPGWEEFYEGLLIAKMFTTCAGVAAISYGTKEVIRVKVEESKNKALQEGKEMLLIESGISDMVVEDED